MDMATYLWIGIAGFLGANVRYIVGRWIAAQWGATFPYATLAINLSGSFLLCFLMALWAQGTAWPPAVRVALTVGFLGAYTTFSTFSYECLVLLQQGSLWGSMAYMLASVLGGGLAGGVGFLVGRWL
jgi:fluoride exporter